MLWDTGGVGGAGASEPVAQAHRAAEDALHESDVLLFIVDAKQGLSPIDQELARILRRSQKPIVLVINKIDDPKHENLAADFASLGFDNAVSISAAHGRGISELLDAISPLLPATASEIENRPSIIENHRDHRSPECRQIFADQFDHAERARNRERVAGNNPRRDRHFLRARRSTIPLHRHGWNPPPRQTVQFCRSLQRDARGAKHSSRRSLRVDCRCYSWSDGAGQTDRGSHSKSAESGTGCFEQMGLTQIHHRTSPCRRGDRTKTRPKGVDQATCR